MVQVTVKVSDLAFDVSVDGHATDRRGCAVISSFFFQLHGYLERFCDEFSAEWDKGCGRICGARSAYTDVALKMFVVGCMQTAATLPQDVAFQCDFDF